MGSNVHMLSSVEGTLIATTSTHTRRGLCTVVLSLLTLCDHNTLLTAHV